MKIRASYSKKQIETIQDFGKDPIVCHSGCFGCGKTFSVGIALGMMCLRLKQAKIKNKTIVLCGRTQGAVKKNICKVLSDKFGEDFKYSKSVKDGYDKDAILFDQIVYIIGLSDSTAEEKFRGLSDIFCVVWDEAALGTRDQFSYILGRLRGETGKDTEWDEGDELVDVPDTYESYSDESLPGIYPHFLVMMCNPDGPKHWIKDLEKEGLVKMINWHMADAIWRGAKKYYESLKKQYARHKIFYARYLLGEWVSSDGLVYSMFSEKVHILDRDVSINYKDMKRCILGLDFGMNHKTALSIIWQNWQNTYIYERCKTWQNTAPSDIASDIAWIIQTFVIDRKARQWEIFIDPSAAALKVELAKQGITALNAANEHKSGIGFVQVLFSSDRLFIMPDNTGELVDELYTYKYKDGSDEVVKEDDDVCDSLRYGVFSSACIHGEL